MPINLMRPCVRDVQSQRLNHALNLTHCPSSPPENHLGCEHPLIHFLNINLEERESMCHVIERLSVLLEDLQKKMYIQYLVLGWRRFIALNGFLWRW